MARRRRRLLRRAVLGLLGLLAAVWMGATAWWAWTLASAPAELRVPTTRGCDDGDPCTIDFWHEFRGQCVYAPDPLCVKACDADADCAFDPDLAPCIDGTCHDGQCSFVELAPQDCQTCASTDDCAPSACSTVACTGGRCRTAPRDCDDGEPTTWDRCAEETGGCEHLLADGLRACEADADCASDHPCEQLACTDGLCRVTPETAGCAQPLDVVRACDPDAPDANAACIQDGAACVAGPCSRDGFCVWREVDNATDCTYCEGDHQCEGSFCQWPVCTGAVCVVEDVPFCQDRNPATDDVCSEERKACLHPWTQTPPACTEPPEDDGDPATVDACVPETGEGVHLPAAGEPCETTNLCWSAYPGPDGFCLAEQVACHDDDGCGATCDPAVGCVVDDGALCPCSSDGDCDLGSPCARTICMGQGDGPAHQDGGLCWGTLIDGCVPCEADADCRVDDWCIAGTCSADGTCDYQTMVTCDDGDPTTTGFCHGHKDETCSFERLSRASPDRPGGCAGP